MIDDGFRLLPEQASAHAAAVDALYYFLLLVAVCFTAGIAGTIVYFMIKYRHSNQRVDRSRGSENSTILEAAWIVGPLMLSLLLFGWGTSLYVAAFDIPADALEVQVVAKQWMWKFQHSNGRREINELHVPRAQAVRLTMISEDVIHSLYVPVFRMKRDVLPGSYGRCWFQATRTGEFHLFCAEYCGTNHSRMTGRVVVMEPVDYEAWLAGGLANEPPSQAGQRLFEELRCVSCHVAATGISRCPPLENVFGNNVRLTSGATVVADENYLRESILHPAAKVVNGYEPLMPSFAGQVNEEQLIQLVAYVKSLSKPTTVPAAERGNP